MTATLRTRPADIGPGGDDMADILTHYDLTLRPDPSRTVLRPFAPEDPSGFAHPGHPRSERIIARVLDLGDMETQRLLDQMRAGLGERHRGIDATLRARFEVVKGDCGGRPVSEAEALLIGAYFVEEYSFESAALFNPSIVPLPDQAGCPDGGVRFAMSLRGIGEGHVSSVTFRTGSWVPGETPIVDPLGRYAASPTIEASGGAGDDAVVRIGWQAIEDVSEAVLFPVLQRHRQGIEDARFVRFVEDDGDARYYATATGFSGTETRTELICASSLDAFELHPLSGRAATGKGMALFPRRIDGRYVMLGRQDNENLWLMRSDDLFVWDEADRLLAPAADWEFVQIGNCGSPIEIDEGWLVLTHGVGPGRGYAMGACLLDKADPAKVLARTSAPLLRPGEQERDGYVPNVVYGCGSMVVGRTLLIPYGVADSVTRFASGSVDDVLAAMG